MAHWAKLRTVELSHLFHFEREKMPHYIQYVEPGAGTWRGASGGGTAHRSVFCRGCQKVSAQARQHSVGFGWENLAWDDPLGETRGVHLLAAYLPEQQGVVLAQMHVEEKSNEITHAPKLLRQMDLRGVVGSSDAMFDQRALNIQIVQAKGDYLWTVKDNQEGLREDIEVLFQPHRKRAGTSALPNDFRTARTLEKGHGRLE